MSTRLDKLNEQIQGLKAQGHLTAEQKSQLAVLYTQRQKEMLNEQIRQQLVAKKNEAPKPQAEIAAKTPEDILKEKATKGFSLLPKPEELDFSKPIQGLSIEKTIKPDNAES